MKIVGNLFRALLLFVVMLHATAHGYGASRENCGSSPLGDEDPFPLHCVDFSGNWKSDLGDHYIIKQRNCSWLKVQMFFGTEMDSQTIVPDNRLRPVPGSVGGQVRHRWNSLRDATVLESNRITFVGACRVNENSMFEQANEDLFLETTYREISCNGGSGEVRREYNQQIFRRTSEPPPRRPNHPNPKDKDGLLE